MAENVIEYDCECGSCRGAGVYVGMGERGGAAVVCSICKGSGEVHRAIKYRDFEGRQIKENVRRVFQANPGIGIGEGNGYQLEDFGGMPYDDWRAGGSFPARSEDRRHTCPAWFYQSADYKLKPDWSDGEVQCGFGGSFSACKHFGEKHKCWARWDSEQQLLTPAKTTV